jgi:hypothetical protein
VTFAIILFAENTTGGFEHLGQTKRAEQRATKIISLAKVNLATPNAGAKHDPLSDKPASEH